MLSRDRDFVEDDAFFPGPELAAALADHAPSTWWSATWPPRPTGVKFADQANSLELCQRALELARAFLKPGGRLVVKIFQGRTSRPSRPTCGAASPRSRP
jgi:23S rRNA (uridine2552-2'-O)-methyltransferase